MKKSIHLLVAVIVIIMSSSVLKAQKTVLNNSGVYLTADDFKTGKLSYILTHKDKLQLNAFFGGKKVGLIYQGKKIKLYKSEIFGYRLNNEVFRFVNNKAYRILDTTGFILYSCPQLTQQAKGNVPVERYYFSLNAKQPISSLTMANLLRNFAGQTAFRYRLQNHFKSDDELISYDNSVHQYAIKYLYNQSQQVLASHNDH